MCIEFLNHFMNILLQNKRYCNTEMQNASFWSFLCDKFAIWNKNFYQIATNDKTFAFLGEVMARQFCFEIYWPLYCAKKTQKRNWQIHTYLLSIWRCLLIHLRAVTVENVTKTNCARLMTAQCTVEWVIFILLQPIFLFLNICAPLWLRLN